MIFFINTLYEYDIDYKYQKYFLEYFGILEFFLPVDSMLLLLFLSTKFPIKKKNTLKFEP